jgi:hypothetical protein
MTTAEKKTWLENATPEELLAQYISLNSGNRYGVNSEDIELTKAEIIKRMSK